jgi:DNA gyrase subunit A
MRRNWSRCAPFATPRLSEITAAADGIDDEDLIEREDMVVTVTMDGYIKRTPLSTFRAQARGGKGRAGMATKDEDAVATMFVTTTHNPVLFFSTAGKVYRLKVYACPRVARPRAVVRSSTCCPRSTGRDDRRPCCRPRMRPNGASLSVSSPRPRAMCAATAWMPSPTSQQRQIRHAFDEGDEDRLIGVALLDASDDVLLASRQGKAIRFAADEVREFTSRTSTGVRGMALKGEDEVISLSILHRVGTPARSARITCVRAVEGREGRRTSLTPERMAELAAEQFILTVCANGYGKLSSAYEYRRTGAAVRASPISTTSPATARWWPASPPFRPTS